MRRGTKCDCKSTGCGFDPHSRRCYIYLNLYFHFFALVSRQSASLSSATQHAMPPEFGRKSGTECLNTRFPLPTLLCAGYRVKLIKQNDCRLKFYLDYVYISLFRFFEILLKCIDVWKYISKIWWLFSLKLIFNVLMLFNVSHFVWNELQI